jgi:hypothetical protein
MDRRFLPDLWPEGGREPVAAGGESRARFTAQFTMGVVSLTIPLRHVLVDGSSRRCSWTASPSTNWRRWRYAAGLSDHFRKDFHRFLKEISFARRIFRPGCPLVKIEGRDSKVGGNESPCRKPVSSRCPQPVLDPPPVDSGRASLATNSPSISTQIHN